MKDKHNLNGWDDHMGSPLQKNTFPLARGDIDYRRAGARSRREMHEMKRKPYLYKRAHT